MNLVEELQSLDVNDVGRWPLPFVARHRDRVCAVVGLGIYWFTISRTRRHSLQRAEGRDSSCA